MSALWQDIRYGFRMLHNSPGFTAVAVLSLALGIGANTAVFSLVNAILLGSLPIPNPHELRVIEWSGADTQIGTFTGNMVNVGPGRTGGDSVSHPVFRALRKQCTAQADIFGYATLYNITVRGPHEPFMAEGLMVSDNFLSGLGVQPLFGRLIGPGDEGAGTAPTVVISYRWWQRQFDFDPDVLGQSVMLNAHSYTIVGVLPREFAGVHPGAETEFYVSMSAQPQLMPGWPPTSPKHWWVRLMARLKPGISDEQFQATLDVAFARETETLMKQPKVLMVDGRAGPAYERNYYRKPLLLLLGVVGVVLLVVCANLAGLLIARGAARRHEFAVRAAVGAGRWRLIRQSLTESILVALLGAGLGIILAFWGKTTISRLLAGSLEGLHYDTSLDLAVLGFTLATALVTALLSGLLPALRVASVDPFTELKDRTALGAPRLRVGKLLVSAQISLSLLLLAGAGLYVRTLVNLVHIDPGFATENLLLFQVNAHNAGYRGARTVALYDNIQSSMAAIPGVHSAALTQFALLAGGMSGGGFFSLPGHSFEGQLKPQAHRLTVSETFFTTMGIPVRMGRELRATDTDEATKVVVVNEMFVRKYLPGEDSIGQTLRTDEWRGQAVDWQIVGVCADVKYRDIKDEAPPTVYFSFRQDFIAATYFAVRTSLPPLAVAKVARKAVAAIDADIPLSNISTQQQVRDKRISQERMFATLCGSLASLAVLLSCIGLYGLMAYNVNRRTGEIGIRIALGAQPKDVGLSILREAVLLAAAGLAVGVPVAIALTRLIKSQLYGVAPADPVTLTAVSILLIAVAILSAWIPARRAAKVDPMKALRCE